MARQDSIIKLNGTIDGISFYKSKDGHLARKAGGVSKARIASDPAFIRTRENGSEFGRAGSAGKVLRTALRGLMQKASDSRVSSRLTAEMVHVIKADETSDRGLRNVLDGEVEMLQGFEFGGGLLQGEVVVINHNFYSGGMHGQRLAKRTRLAHQHAAALAQGAVDGLDDAGLPRAFGAGPVLPPRQHLGVGFPLVGEEPTMPAVMPWQRPPKLAQGRFAPAAQRPARDAPPGPLDGQPEPDLALSTPHEGPQFIGFERFPPLARGVGRARRRPGRRGKGRFFLSAWQSSSGPRP